MIGPKISYFCMVIGVAALQFLVHSPAPKLTADAKVAFEPNVSRAGLDAGMTALHFFYDSSTGLWSTAKWWNSANALETTIDYAKVTKATTYQDSIANTFERFKDHNFLSPWFYDDEGWWALAWIKAYDLTGEQRYLDMAKTIFNDIKQGWSEPCGGGVWWTKDGNYKNAITNELFMAVAARLHLRTPGDGGPGSYLEWAQKTWNWFRQSGMINGNNLVNDGLDGSCKNNGQTTWTYNQGVVLGALADLYRATNDPALLTQADTIAQSTMQQLAPRGVLREPCEPTDCGIDGSQFKGVFIRNLLSLYQVSPKPAYRAFILKNADSVWAQSRNLFNQFGLSWEGPFDQADAVRQSSAMDALIAAYVLNSPAQVAAAPAAPAAPTVPPAPAIATAPAAQP